jgi:dihydroorotate dehydrogenase (fumarate)
MRHGFGQIGVIEQEMREGLIEHEYVSVRQMQGSMSQRNCPDPTAFERAQYVRTLQSYDPAGASVP